MKASFTKIYSSLVNFLNHVRPEQKEKMKEAIQDLCLAKESKGKGEKFRVRLLSSKKGVFLINKWQ
jgi:hypothetical protein